MYIALISWKCRYMYPLHAPEFNFTVCKIVERFRHGRHFDILTFGIVEKHYNVVDTVLSWAFNFCYCHCCVYYNIPEVWNAWCPKKPNTGTTVDSSDILFKLLKYFISWPSPSLSFTANIYRPQRSCGKVMILHLSVILSTGGVADPQGRHPPGQIHPPGQTPPPDTVNKWAVHILLECILVSCFIV